MLKSTTCMRNGETGRTSMSSKNEIIKSFKLYEKKLEFCDWSGNITG